MDNLITGNMEEDLTAADTLLSNTLASDSPEEQSDLDHFEPRQATLFLVDATSPMFEEDPNTGKSPFMKSLEAYANNMQQMCGYNRDDWMSLMLFGTNTWDKEPETKNVLTVQKFHKISLDMLKEIRDKIENRKTTFNCLSSDSTYPLHDALWHASQAFSGVRRVIITRKIVLFTCEDNPFVNDANECHRIRARVLTFRNLRLDLCVIGLKDHFNQDLFYKDLEIISTGIDPKCYKKHSFEDLEEEIQYPSRTISNISWKFSKNVEIPVSIFTVSTGTRYPERIYINRTTNEPLFSHSVYRKERNDDESDEDENGAEFESKVVSDGGVAKFQEHGDKKIVFDVKEINMMFDHFVKGVETLCFMPIECDPMYHVEPPKFLCFNETTASETQKEFFTTLIAKCEAKDLMVVCRITYRIHNAPYVYYFYPSMRRGGFFIYKLAYEDHVRNLDDILSHTLFSKNNQTDCPEDAIKLFDKIVKKTRIRFDPNLFKNPKLGSLIANIEALALDLDQKNIPPDFTLPTNKIKERLADLMPEYYRIFGEDEEVPAKRVKIVDDDEMRNLALTRRVEICTIPQLKQFLKEHGLSATGSKKIDFVTKVYQFFQNQ